MEPSGRGMLATVDAPRAGARPGVNPVQAIAGAVRDTGPAADYSRFHAAVAHAQLTQWLAELAPRRGADEGPSPLRPAEPAELAPRERTPLLIDVSGAGARAAEAAARAGHSVLRVVEPGMPPPAAGGCADGVIAEDRTLSRRLAAEAFVADIARVLRPGGQVLACVDSLNLGMAVLAEQHHWPHLADVPNADVVLVPWPDGTITRCYGAEQLRELFTGNGLAVRWIRPRTVFSPRTVSYLLARDPRSFGRLVSAELSARADDSVGAQLIICARRR